MFYNFTVGPKHEKINKNPFYTTFDLEFYCLDIIKEILKDDKINIDYIDNYYYYDENKKGYIRIIDQEEYKKPLNKFILELNYKEYNPILYEYDNLYSKVKKKYINLIKQNDELKKLKKDNEKYDLIYLYACPLQDHFNEEKFKTIDYRIEINQILKCMSKSKKQYNCLFECANEKNFRNFLKKPTKILQISSHGYLNNAEFYNEMNMDYSLILEENGEINYIDKNSLEEILKSNANNIKNIDLIIVSTCYSQSLGQLFYKYKAKNVIYIHGLTPISNLASVIFNEYFYEELVKGKSIEEAFNKSKERTKINRIMLIKKPNNCCCSCHKHKNKCPLNGEHHEDIYDMKICECNFEEFNIHEKYCKFINYIFEQNKQSKFTYKIHYQNGQNYLKICCCGYKNKLEDYYKINNDINENQVNNNDENEIEIPHNEYNKFILLSNKDEKNCEKIKVFENNKKGKIIRNSNIIYEDFKNKNFSIIGRRPKMKIIYDIISGKSKNSNNHQIIIITGSKEIGKQNFVESLCFYLFERRVIKHFTKIIEIQKMLDRELIKNIINNYKNKYKSEEKVIVVLKISYILDENSSLALVKYILEGLTINAPNIFVIIILPYDNSKYLELNYKIIELEKLEARSAEYLYNDILNYLGYENKLRDKSIFEMIDFEPKKINYIIQLICEGEENFDGLVKKVKELIMDEKIEENKKGKDNFQKLFLLCIMKSGLPYSIIKLIYPEPENFFEKDETYSYIYQNNDGWYYIDEISKRKIFKDNPNQRNIKTKCIKKCLEVYSKLLFFFIQKKIRDICLPDNNIHYIFNSFNGKGIWKTFNEEYYIKCFPYNKISYNEEQIQKEVKQYKNILEDESDFEKHKENILYFIENNIDILLDLLKIENIYKEYLEQILIMLPSCYFLDNNCSYIIKKCIIICQKLELNLSRKRLILFLKSLEKTEVDPKDFNELPELLGEALFLKGLKNEDMESFKESVNNYKNILNNELKNYKLSFAYYEIGGLFCKNENFIEAQNYLNLAKKCAIESGNNFLKERINIDLSLIIFNQSKKEKDERERNKLYLCSNEFLMEEINQKKEKGENNYNLKQLAKKLKDKLNSFLMPDITILNSNPLTNNYGVLNSGIYAYHNNHYFLLQEISRKIKSHLKINSLLLNENNLISSINKEGKILIIQSDDYSEKGQIILETEISNDREESPKIKIGESRIYSNEDLEILLSNKKIKYEIVILCFINSIKLKEIFENKTQYLITFEEIDCFNLNNDLLLKYNKLSIDFLIDFISRTTEKTIFNAFEESKKKFQDFFIKELRQAKIKSIGKYENKNYIHLKRPDDITNKKIKYENLSKKIFLYYPLLDINIKSQQIYKYTYDIIKIINEIVKVKQKISNEISRNIIDRIINIDISYEEETQLELDEKINQIAIEVLKFFHRHRTFKFLFYINQNKNKKQFFKKIKKFQFDAEILILVNNNHKIKFFRDKEDPLEDYINAIYFNFENKKLKNNNEMNKDSKINLNIQENQNNKIINNDILNDLDSIFTYKFKNDEKEYDNEYEDE